MPDLKGGIFAPIKLYSMKTLFTIAAITVIFLAQASGTFSMIEINPLHGAEQSIFTDSSKTIYGAGEVSGFIDLNGRLYFTAQDTFGNEELWSTDGTQGGTVLVKDINPNGSSSIGNMVKVGNRLLFMAADNNNFDFDLWSTDGTSSGTVKVTELNQLSNSSLNPQNISVMGSRLLFCTQTQLMITNGTTAGTDSLLAITTYSQGFGYCDLNSKVYFLLPNMNNGQFEIWRTDGTIMGTERVINPSSAMNITSINSMLSFDGKIYLDAAISGQGNDLFSFDGNINGQIQKINLVQGGNSYPGNLTLYDNAFYFTASNLTSANVYRITVSNPTPESLIQNASFSWINNVTFANNSIYFLGESQQQIHRVDLNTLNHTITQLTGYSVPYYTFTNNGILAGKSSKVFMALYDSLTNKQSFFEANESLSDIHMIQPESANTLHPFSFILGCGIIDVFDLKLWGDKVIFPANFNDAGRELWIFKADDLINNLEPLDIENSYRIFPNPGSTELSIEMNDKDNSVQDVNVYNNDGALVLKASQNSAAKPLNISSLAAGNYLVTIRENGKFVGTKKFVVSK